MKRKRKPKQLNRATPIFLDVDVEFKIILWERWKDVLPPEWSPYLKHEKLNCVKEEGTISKKVEE